MLKRGFVGRGMHLEFSHPAYRAPITTSRIEEIRECPKHCDALGSRRARMNDDSLVPRLP
jgi:hypothetical protein